MQSKYLQQAKQEIDILWKNSPEGKHIKTGDIRKLSQINQPIVEEYLVKNHKKMPRVAYRYALEKFDSDTRKKLMKL